jgi:hypothetical protein
MMPAGENVKNHLFYRVLIIQWENIAGVIADRRQLLSDSAAFGKYYPSEI